MATSSNTKRASGSPATQTPSSGTKTTDLVTAEPPPSTDGDVAGTNKRPTR